MFILQKGQTSLFTHFRLEIIAIQKRTHESTSGFNLFTVLFTDYERCSGKTLFFWCNKMQRLYLWITFVGHLSLKRQAKIWISLSVLFPLLLISYCDQGTWRDMSTLLETPSTLGRVRKCRPLVDAHCQLSSSPLSKVSFWTFWTSTLGCIFWWVGNSQPSTDTSVGKHKTSTTHHSVTNILVSLQYILIKCTCKVGVSNKGTSE